MERQAQRSAATLKPLVRTAVISTVIAFTPLLRGQGAGVRNAAGNEPSTAMSIIGTVLVVAGTMGATRQLHKGKRIESETFG
jgi:hypothetical protein